MSVTLSMSSRPNDKTVLVLGIGLLVSVALHGSGLLWATLQKNAPVQLAQPIVVELIQVAPPPPPPPEPEEVKPVEPPKPKVPLVKLAVVKPPPKEPPPPLEEAPQPPKEPPPLFVGVKMSSTTSAGTFAAPEGNTAYGQMPKTTAAEVKPYAAPNYVPPGSADRDPEVDHEFKVSYPDEARRAGVEGTVRLRIVVDNEGRVVDAKVLNGPGYGLNEAAREAIKKFKFKAAIKGGEPVSTTMVYNYRFVLD